MTGIEYIQAIFQRNGHDVRIVAVSALAGGASREMLLIEAETAAGERRRFVLRRDTPTQMNERALTRTQEFALMNAAADAGIRVARPLLLHEGDAETPPFFIMPFIDGTAIGRKVVNAPELAEARAVLPGQMAEQLARIHALDPAVFTWLPRPQDGLTAAEEAVQQCYAVLDRVGAVSPTFEYLLRWALRHQPEPGPLTLCHGDFRIGNLMVHAGGLAAVMDWEFAHVGDPHEELGYLCMRDWRFGGPGRMGGIAEREQFLSAYEQASGRRVDRRAVDYWEFLGNVRWGVICLAQAERHLSGKETSVELASLGRRSAEMQMEALLLIKRMEATRA
ncbi:MAG: phosphotransferase family protein [Anaerolinea sp.]|nr:phosphotransferase family protein [Anaerolinea sp.]